MEITHSPIPNALYYGCFPLDYQLLRVLKWYIYFFWRVLLFESFETDVLDLSIVRAGRSGEEGSLVLNQPDTTSVYSSGLLRGDLNRSGQLLDHEECFNDEQDDLFVLNVTFIVPKIYIKKSFCIPVFSL